MKLLDFGIARLLDDGSPDGATPTTATRGSALTPEYAAPEQLGAGAITTATDVYALGVLLFQLLSGQHPTAQDARTAVDFLKALDQPATRLTAALRRAEARHEGEAIARARSTTLAKLLKTCGGDLDPILNVALKQAPAERYAGAAAFADDIRRYLRRLPVGAQPDSTWYRLRMLAARRKVESVAAAVTVLAVVGGAGVACGRRGGRRRAGFRVRQLQRAQAMNDLNEFLLTDAARSQGVHAGDVLARAEAIAMKQQGGDIALRSTRCSPRQCTPRRTKGQQPPGDGARHNLSRTVSVWRCARRRCGYAASISDAGDYARATPCHGRARGLRRVHVPTGLLPDAARDRRTVGPESGGGRGRAAHRTRRTEPRAWARRCST
jgi:hypothetical protein